MHLKFFQIIHDSIMFIFFQMANWNGSKNVNAPKSQNTIENEELGK